MNEDFRKFARSKKVPLWMVADVLEISEATMTRRLRRELSEEDTAEMIAIINKIAAERR